MRKYTTCGNCFYLYPTEAEQDVIKRPHFCNKYKKRVLHLGNHPLLPRLPECHLILHLHLKYKWFDEVLAGTKTTELRLASDHNRLLLANRWYDEIWLYRAYEKAVDGKTLLKRQWRLVALETVLHEEFGKDPVDVYVIDIAGEIE